MSPKVFLYHYSPFQNGLEFILKLEPPIKILFHPKIFDFGENLAFAILIECLANVPYSPTLTFQFIQTQILVKGN